MDAGKPLARVLDVRLIDLYGRPPMRRLFALLWLTLAGCLAPVTEPSQRSYHNPLDLSDAGALGDAGGGGDAGLLSRGTIDTRTPNLFSATYAASQSDAGRGAVEVFISDVGNLCLADTSDGGLGPSWDLLRLHIAADVPGTYPVAAVLPPNGAVAQFDYQSDAGGFGTSPAVGGTIVLQAVDQGNRQPASGTYELSFSGTDSMSGSFSAVPCAAVPPAPGH